MTVDVWDLVSRSQAGEPEAFGQLYDWYVDDVYDFVYRRVGSQPAAEFVTADVFFAALRGILDLSPDRGTPREWLLTIATDAVTRHLGATQARPRRRKPGRGCGLRSGDFGRDHEAGMLRGLIRKLDGDHRRCLELRYLDGLELGEIAERMGRSVRSVEALHFHAIRRLHRIIDL